MVYVYCEISNFLYLYFNTETEKFMRIKQYTRYKKHTFKLNPKYDIPLSEKKGLTEEEQVKKYKKLLKKFAKDLIEENEKLKPDLDYLKYYNDYDATIFTFKRFATNAIKQHKLEGVNINELKWINNCPNGGLIYLNEKYRGETVNCYGYDYKKFYANMMTRFWIPKKGGEEKILDELPKTFCYGYFRVNIKGDINNELVKRYHQWSKFKTYTYNSLTVLQQLKTKHNVNIDIEMIKDGEPNAYIYKKDDMIQGRLIFQRWYDKLMEVESKNKGFLIKNLISQLHGCLMKPQCDYYNFENLPENTTLDSIISHDHGKKDIFQVVRDKNNVFRNGGLGRIKAFLSSYCRAYMYQTFNHVEMDIIKIRVDGIVFNNPYRKQHTATKKFLKLDDSYTGKFKIHSMNHWERII